MNSDVFSGNGANAEDQWTFDSTTGAGQALQNHWKTYFTEADVETLKSYGINALRIPIGFWAYDNTGTPYISYGIGQGADNYLEQAIGWAQNAGLKVWVDCHGSPGSQNGFDNSGHMSDVEWQQGNNIAKSIAILTTMAKKYGSVQYSDTVIAIELVNEPTSSGANNFNTTQQFAREAYAAVKGNATSPDLMIVMHDAFEGPDAWTNVAQSLGPKGSFGIDTHLYQTLTDSDKALTQAEHISTACQRGEALGSANIKVPVYVGEWTATTNACINSDGSSTAQTCSNSGCVCVTDSMDNWTDEVIEQVRRFMEAQLESFEAYTSGYFFWSWADSDMGTWSIQKGIAKGIIPNPLDDPSQRKYPGQCNA
ncbi:exo-1,3-beta-glucanase [Mycoblastus sanguinarius]|nr:exo-1,3-beta-glucanase [Mycoblastus sanguinarius]